jgi:hypothetical protein
MAIRIATAPLELQNHAGANCSAEIPPHERNQVVKPEAHPDRCFFKKFNVKTNFKLKINVIWQFCELQIIPTKPSVDLPNFVRLSL